jgi:hypothetical protein
MFARPNELAVLVSLGKDADEARLSVERSSDILCCDAGVAPCGVDCGAHLVLGGVSGAVVEAVDSCGCAAG